METVELIKRAIEFAMGDLCNGFLDMPCGCEGCPLWNVNDADKNGSVDCRGNVLKAFLEEYPEELKEQ